MMFDADDIEEPTDLDLEAEEEDDITENPEEGDSILP